MLTEDTGWVDFNATPRYVKEALEYAKGGEAIDVGSHTGRNTFFLAENGFDVTAVDTSHEHLLELAEKSREKNVPIDCITTDILHLQTTKTFDLVLCTMVMHFLDDQDLRDGFNKLKDLTTPGGINLVSVLLKKDGPIARPHLFEPGELREHYTDWEILDYLEGSGPKYQENDQSPVVRAPRAIIIARKPAEE